MSGAAAIPRFLLGMMTNVASKNRHSWMSFSKDLLNFDYSEIEGNDWLTKEMLIRDNP
jgi:hypothetical protein